MTRYSTTKKPTTSNSNSASAAAAITVMAGERQKLRHQPAVGRVPPLRPVLACAYPRSYLSGKPLGWEAA